MKSKRHILMAIVFVAILAGTVILWKYYRWPAGELDAQLLVESRLTLDETATVTLRTNQDFLRTQRIGVSAKLEGMPMDASAGTLEDDAGRAIFHFKIKPQAVVHDQPLKAALNVRGKTIVGPAMPITVPMPLFYKPQESSFMEMVSMPNASPYGSHITLWHELGDAELFLATGHAASNVCRVVSAALFGLAYQTDIASAYFTIGAGVVCIDVTGLQKEIDAQKSRLLQDFPEIAAQFAELRKADRMPAVLERLGQGMTPEQLVIYQRDTEQERLHELSEAMSGDWIEGVHLKREDLKTLAVTLSAIQKKMKAADASPISQVERLPRVTRNKTLERAPAPAFALTPEEITTLQALITDPNLALAVRRSQESEELETVLTLVRGWEKGKRESFKAELQKLAEKSKAFETATRQISEQRERTGLVRFDKNSTIQRRADVDLITGNVATWAQQNSAPREIELAALAAGHEGCALLPFFDAAGKPIEFAITESILSTPQNKEWREAVRNNTSAELAATADDVRKQVQKAYEDALEQIKRTAPTEKDDIQTWAPIRQKFSQRVLDSKGRLVRTEQVENSNLRTLIDSWETAASFRELGHFYKRLAESSRTMKEDLRFQQISDACLIDSLLRGWKLAFSDDETEKKFEAWSQQARDTVWAELWRQAGERKLNLRGLRTEATVFKVSSRDDKIIVRPLFAADIAQTRCVRSRDGALVGYRSTWEDRKAVHYEVSAGPAAAKTPAELADGLLAGVDRAVTGAAATIENLPPGERAGALISARGKLVKEAGKDFRTALSAVPERAVAALVRGMLGLWPEPPVIVVTAQERAAFEQLDAWFAVEGGLDEQWAFIRKPLLEGAWPFADEYLSFALLCEKLGELKKDPAEKAMLKRTTAQLIAQGEKIDAEFIKAGMANPAKAPDQRSKKRFELEAKRLQFDTEHVIAALRIITLLNEGERSIEDWDEAQHNMFLLDEAVDALEAAPDTKGQGARIKLLTQLRDNLFVHRRETEFPNRAKEIAEAGDLLAVIGNALKTGPEASDVGGEYGALLWRVSYLAGRIQRSALSTAAVQKTTTSTRPRVLAALRECRELMRAGPKTGWLGKPLAEQREKLDALIVEIEHADYDALDRRKFLDAIGEMLSAVGRAAGDRVQSMHQLTPTRRTLEMLVQLEWRSGQYRAALDKLVRQTIGHFTAMPGRQPPSREEMGKTFNAVPIERLDDLAQALLFPISEADPQQVFALMSALAAPQNPRRAAMVQALFYGALFADNGTHLLKACVYSGGEFFGTSIFGRRPNDWVHQPTTIEEVVVQIQQPSASRFDEAAGEAFARLRERVAASTDANAALQPGEKIGNYTLVRAHQSFTDLRAFEVMDDAGNASIVKVMPADPAGANARQMEAGADVANYLARNGADVPPSLPVPGDHGRKVLVTKEGVITRETMAHGEQLSTLVNSNTGRLTPKLEDAYIDATFDLALRGKNLPDDLAYRPGVTTVEGMHDRLLARSDESVAHFDAFARTDLYRQQHGPNVASKGAAFHASFKRFIDTFWAGDKRLEETGLVHDAILKNYFAHDGKLTAIDFASDYVGSVGHSISIMATQMQKRGAAWDFPTFRNEINRMIGSYEAKVGRKLTPGQRLEIVQHLSFHPYKFVSSDSGQFLRGLKQELNLPATATETELVAATREPGNLAKVEKFLADPEGQQKLKDHLQMVENSLKMLREELPPGDTRLSVLDEFIGQVEAARASGLRVTDAAPSRARWSVDLG